MRGVAGTPGCWLAGVRPGVGIAKLWTKATFVLLVALMTGCGGGRDVSDANIVMRSYYEAIQAKHFEKALTFYAPEFYERTSREEWLQTLSDLNSKLGDLQTYQMSGYRIEAGVGAGLTGAFLVMQYRVTYSKYPADETVTLIRSGPSNEMRILSHQIASQGLLK
jgi:hypothetical protein